MPGPISGESQEVISLTIEELMESYGLNFIDILKIDIEGAEKEVFSNSPPWLAKIGMIAIELHDKIKIGCNRSFYRKGIQKWRKCFYCHK
jgi:isoaspartyl peptidase/L-asparaginase-like protein (Ntn-hydrolase superfamily)